MALLAGAALSAAASAGPERAVLRLIDVPSELRPGRASIVSVSVTNNGGDTWPAGGAIRLSYRLLGEDGRIQGEGDRSLLSTEVPPGATLTICRRLIAPRSPGTYIVEWDMVHEGVAWLGEQNGSGFVRQALLVSDRPPEPSRRDRVQIAAWLLLTVGHFLLMAVWTNGLLAGCSPTIDERFFVTMLLGIGVLQSALHIVAITIGLGLISVGLALAAAHAVLALCGSRTDRGVLQPTTDRPASERDRWPLPELAAVIVVVAFLAQWTYLASMSLDVTGTDAAHYHVPHAVNLALGVSPFAQAATPHLYPMGTSMTAAWFILPFGDPMLVDLVMVPYFLLLLASLCWLFRLVTDASGLAFVPWFALWLFDAPLMRLSRLMSADLSYAAAFIALLVHLAALVRRARLSRVDVLLGGLALGVLLGTKTTATPAAVLLTIVGGLVVWVSRDRAARDVMSRRALFSAAVISLALASAGGGVWVIRNWLNYGSPIAPMGMQVAGLTLFAGQTYEATRYYLSALGEMNELGAARFWIFTRRFLNEWMGAWFVPAAWLALFAWTESLASSRAGHERQLARFRAALISTSAVVLAALTGLLLGAPWTSLRWTRGLALRYMLPGMILIPFFAYLFFFPLRWPWYRQRRAPYIGGLLLAALVMITGSWLDLEPAPGAAPGRLPLAILGAAGISTVGVWLTARRVSERWTRRALAGVALMLGALFGGSQFAEQDARLRADERARFPAVEACPGDDRSSITAHQASYLAILRYERGGGMACERRRIFTATRFDAPLDLQSLPYRTEVFDAQPASLVERELVLHGPGTAPCDYIIASKAELETLRGSPLVNRVRARHELMKVGESGPYDIFAVGR